VVKAAVELSERYVTDRYLPDKAIDLIDEAGSGVNLTNEKINEVEKLKNDLKQIQQTKENYMSSNNSSEEMLKRLQTLK
jgi:ATP-dependent Clp protease ATP-binding subunit ClpA